MIFFERLKDIWRNRERLGDANQSRELAAFLPPALEIQASPPNPLARWLYRALLSLVIVAIAWAIWGRVNIVASAEGKIVPSSRVKQVQSLEKGVVKALFVSEGDRVTKGQPIVELDSAHTQADEQRLKSELHSTRMQLAVSRALLTTLEDISAVDAPSISLELGEDADLRDVILHQSLLRQQWLQYRSQRQVLRSGLEKTQAQQSATREEIVKLEKTLPLARKRTSNLKSLHAEEFISEDEFLAAELEVVRQVQDLAVERENLKQLHATVDEMREKISLFEAQSKSELLFKIAELQREVTSLEEEYNKARDIDDKQVLYAPVTGRVQDLAINTIGGVVTSAEQLMLIVPDESQLEVEVFLENKDIGFVREKMPAEIKIHTFPFTKYGVIDAEVKNVADDATVHEQRGLIYRMQLVMSTNVLRVGDKDVRLQPGMAVTAEIQTGERRIVEFFMSPLLRYKDESIRER